MSFTVYWEGYFVAANTKINPTLASKNVSLCAGWTKVAASSPEEAARLFQLAFPDTSIVAIK